MSAHRGAFPVDTGFLALGELQAEGLEAPLAPIRRFLYFAASLRSVGEICNPSRLAVEAGVAACAIAAGLFSAAVAGRARSRATARHFMAFLEAEDGAPAREKTGADARRHRSNGPIIRA